MEEIKIADTTINSEIPVQLPKKNFSRIAILLIVVLLIVTGTVYAGMQIVKKQTPVVLPTAPPPNVRPTDALPTPTPVKFIPDDESCIAEGGKGNYTNDLQCCQGLVETTYPSSNPPCAAMESIYFLCIKCGDGKCGNGETKCNCPSDCN